MGLKSRVESKSSRSGYAESLNDWFFANNGGEDEHSTAEQSRKSTVDMQKIVGRECLDFWLTCFERSVAVLRAFPEVSVVFRSV